MDVLKWSGALFALLLSGAVECGNTSVATKEAQGKACATSCSPSAGSNASGTRRHLRYGLEHFSGNLRLWDDATVYAPEYGPWTSFELSLTPGAQTPGLWHGGWNFSGVSYVTTVLASPLPGGVRLYGRGGGYETARANEGSSCSATAGTRCTYPPDAMSKHRLGRPGGDAPALSAYPAAVRALLTDARGFVRALPDGRYEVYGGGENAIRVVSGGYEAWLSATVERSGLSLRWQYERAGDGLRLHSLVDATGLTTRLYYADNEPRFSKVRGFVAELIASQPQVRQLNTSVHDPYGRVTHYAYQDLLTGLKLGELPGTSDAALHAAIRDRSRHWRLLALQDVLGVRSQVRYACGSAATVDTSQVATSVTVLAARAVTLLAHDCLVGSGSSVSFGEQAFDPQQTETPYGVTRFTRIRIGVLGTEEHRRGWIVESPNGDVERVEANFGVISASLERAMRALVTGSESAAMPNVGALLGSRPGHVPQQDWDRLAGLTLADGERTSLHWTHKAADDLVQTRVLGVDALLDPATRLPLSHAHVRQYLHDHALGESGASTSPLLVAEKAPLEGWVFYGYQGAASADTFRNASMNGATAAAAKPTLVVRGLVGGAVQATYVAYGPHGLPTLTVDAVGRAQELVYAANGLDLVDIHAARWNALAPEGSRLTRLERLSHNEYNARGQLQRTEDASGEVTTFGYQASAPYLLESVTDAARGRTTRFTRSVTNPGALPAGRVLHYTTQDPDGFVTTADYQQGWLIGRDADGVSYRWSGHDAFGRPQHYAVDGRIRAVYGYQGLTLTRVTNPADGTRVEIQSDHLGRTAWMGLSNSANELLRSWYYDYDAGGGLRTLWDGRGQAMRWEYDVQGRPLSFQDSDGTRQTLGYDAQISRVNRSTDARGISTYLSYTAAGELESRRLHSATAPPVLSLVHDPVYARVTQRVEASGTTTYRYHPTLPYRVQGSTQPLSGGGEGAATQMLLAFDYALGRMTGWRAQDNRAVAAQSWQEMQFDPRDRVERVTTELFSAFPTYTPSTSGALGRIDAIGYDLTREVSGARVDEVTQHIGYADAAHERRVNERRYESIAGAAQTVFAHIDFDDNDRIWRSQGLIDGSENRYSHDAAGQLRREQRSHFSATGTHAIETDVGYEYDELGNRTEVNTLDAGGMPTAQQVDATYPYGNRLSTYRRGSTTRSAQYDAAGNLTFDPGNGYGYSYNDDNRLQRITYKAGDYTELTYNAAGQVVRVQEYYANVLSEDRTNVYAADGQWIQQRSTADMRILRTINADGYAEHTLNANGKPVVERYLILRNHQGSAIGRVDAQGRVVERVDYSAWGEPARRQLRDAAGNLVNSATLQTAMPIGYAGYPLHHRSGLYLTHYRVYAPRLGRFTQKDPIGISGGPNLYAYVANNPVSFSDPSGLAPRDPARCAQAALELLAVHGMLATRQRDLLRGDGAPIAPGSEIYSFSPQTGNSLSTYQRLLDMKRQAERELVASCSDSGGSGGASVDQLLADGLDIAGDPQGYNFERANSAVEWVTGPDGTDIYIGNRSPWVAGAAVAGVGAVITTGAILSGAGEGAATGAGLVTLATAAFVGLVDFGAWLEGQARAAVW